jgi:uncharacterized protein (DUF2141 family)
MTSVATGFRARREHHRARVVGQRRIAGGVVWIVAVAALLAGVVAVNVAVLQLNLKLDGVNRQRGRLKADIAADQAKLAGAKRTNGIMAGTHGLVQADPATTRVVNLPGH